jgi:hypothetical protein
MTVAREPASGAPLPGPADSLGSTPVALVDLLDRVLGKGVVVTGDLTLSIAEVDLVHISLRALLSSVRARAPRSGADPW